MENIKNILSGSRVLVIGGLGFIGSHVVEQLILEDVKEIIVYDNLSRGKIENVDLDNKKLNW